MFQRKPRRFRRHQNDRNQMLRGGGKPQNRQRPNLFTNGQSRNNFRNLNSTFGKDLYKIVEKTTYNFTSNLTFLELKNRIDEDYLDFMVKEYCTENKNTFILLFQ